jgi:hypothetical protein
LRNIDKLQVSGPLPHLPTMPKKPDDASTRSKSSTQTFKSLATKASATLKTIKQKATELLSPKKKKRTKRSGPAQDSDVDTDTENSNPQSPSETSSNQGHHSNGSVIEIPDEDNSDDELSE